MAPVVRRSRWGTVGIAVACGLGGLLLVMLVFGTTIDSLSPPELARYENQLGVTLLLDLALGALAVALLPLVRRRSYPWALVVVALSFSATAVLVAGYAIVVTASSRRPARIAVLGGVFVVAAVLSDLIAVPIPDESYTLAWVVGIAVVVYVVLALIGLNRGNREAALVALRLEAEAAHREREAAAREQAAERREADARLQQAHDAERTLIAREMHDTLAHHLSLIAVHAGALEYRADLEPERVREAAATVGEAARSASADLRQVLSVLRDGESSTSPLPDLTRLAGLVADGTALTYRAPFDDVTLAQVPASTSRHLYRIAQEALTNARKHAPGATPSIVLGGGRETGLTLEVRNALTTAEAIAPERAPAVEGAGLGLVGIAERARLSGGWCRAGADGEEFVVRAWVPWLA